MKNKNTANHQIEALKKDYESGKLKANLEYQRYNNAWGIQQKNSLIISILENYPIGEIIRNRVNYDGVSEYFEIVDGYQRLTAISEFMNDNFSLNVENSYKVLKNFLEHFKQAGLNDKSILNVIDKYNNNKNIRLKFKNLPKTLQEKISSTEVSVATLSNWERKDVIEYFRRVQEGKPLTNADKLHTIHTELTSKLKRLSSDDSVLNSIGLNLENGKLRKGADRIVYQTSLESIYCRLGNSIGQPKKLDNFFKDKEYTDEIDKLYNKISIFLTSLNSTDRKLFNLKSITTDLKLIFCLILFSDIEITEEFKKYIINISVISGLLKTFNDNKSNESRSNLYEKLDELNLTHAYENNIQIFNEFYRLRWSSHSMNDVKNICSKITNLYKNEYLISLN
jgi:hypothetical protein